MKAQDKKRIKIAIIAWNISQNALSRAYMLADVLSSIYDVKIYGFTFSNKKYSLWEPLKNMDIPVIKYRGCDFPGFTEVIKSIPPEIDADVIIVSKARLPSLQFGLLIKALGNQPLLLDIDDYEIGFFLENILLDNEDIKKPYGELWTRFCEQLIENVDQLFVSNIALQDKYGGAIVPHARDEKIFIPDLYSKLERRKELGISLESKVVLFLGTPREHKGLEQTLEAIKKIGNPNYKLCVMGSFPRKSLQDKLLKISSEHLLMFPDQPFTDIAKNLSVADLVCLFQNQDNETAQYQLPAKAIDAIAMGIPVLATETPPLKPLINQGLVISTNKNDLADHIKMVLSNQDQFARKQLNNRNIFIEKYSYEAVFKTIDSAINNALKKPKVMSGNALEFMDLQSRLFNELSKLLVCANNRYSKLGEKTIEKKYRKVINSRTWRYSSFFRNLAKKIKRIIKFS